MLRLNNRHTLKHEVALIVTDIAPKKHGCDIQLAYSPLDNNYPLDDGLFYEGDRLLLKCLTQKYDYR